MVWSHPSGSQPLFLSIAATLLIGFGVMFAMLQAPSQMRKPIIASVTFVCGLFYVLLWIVPAAQDHSPGDIPRNGIEAVSFKLQDAVGEVGGIATILTALLLGLGAASLIKIHATKIMKGQKDWGFSLVTLSGMASMIVVGYSAWMREKFSGDSSIDFSNPQNWNWALWARDFMFDGLLQKMDAAMFSIIAFYIISAAYRAFRIRSVEATILLATAFIVMLSLLPQADAFSRDTINAMTGNNPSNILENLKLGEVSGFIRTAFQGPAIRGIDFGIGVGALAMGIRLWLSLDKQGAM